MTLFPFIYLYFFFVSAGFSCTEDSNQSIPIEVRGENGIDFNDVQSLIEQVKDIYTWEIFDTLGLKLEIKNFWSSTEVNASSHKTAEHSFEVNLCGGLTRYRLLTKEALILILCHEIGHLMGGAPLKHPNTHVSEGQSDYFASLKCFRKVYRPSLNLDELDSITYPHFVIQKCDQQFTNISDRLLCRKNMMASLQVAHYLHQVQDVHLQRARPEFSTPDHHQVGHTETEYANSQCRLDTHVAGALCERSEDEDVSFTNVFLGTCPSGAGARPRCWFKPEFDY